LAGVPASGRFRGSSHQLLLVHRTGVRAALSRTLFYDAAVEYVATGLEVPSTWLWRRLSRRAPAEVG
jgi:hypothetical protein